MITKELESHAKSKSSKVFGSFGVREVTEKNIYSTITKGPTSVLTFFFNPENKTLNKETNNMMEKLAETLGFRVTMAKINGIDQPKTISMQKN